MDDLIDNQLVRDCIDPKKFYLPTNGKSEQEAERQTKEGRILRRQEQKDALDIIDDSNILYGPGIDDSV